MHKVGACWKKKSKKGELYLSGQLELNGQKIKISIFKNNYKKADKQPDYIIYNSSDRPSPSADDFQDDIPF